MNNTLKALLNMHKEMEIIMAHENAKNKMVDEEILSLQEVMTKRIKDDLEELKDTYYKLGIKQYIFGTDVCLDALELNEKRYQCIGFVFDDSSIRICQFSKKDKNDAGICMYTCLNLRKGNFENLHACIEIYKHWEDIKRSIEYQIVETYFKEQNEKCLQLNRERETATNILDVIKIVLECSR